MRTSDAVFYKQVTFIDDIAVRDLGRVQSGSWMVQYHTVAKML